MKFACMIVKIGYCAIFELLVFVNVDIGFPVEMNAVLVLEVVFM